MKVRCRSAALAANASVFSLEGTVCAQSVNQQIDAINRAPDPAGEWQGSSNFPASIWLGVYGTDNKAKAIELHAGKLTKVSVTLDNSFHLPPDTNGK